MLEPDPDPDENECGSATLDAGPLRPHHPHAMGEVPLGVLLPVPGAAEDQLKGGATVSQHCPAGVQVLPQVSAEDGVQEAVRQAAQPFGPHCQTGESFFVTRYSGSKQNIAVESEVIIDGCIFVNNSYYDIFPECY